MKFFGSVLRKNLTPRCTAIIAAAGSSTRMGGEDKLFLGLSGRPVIYWSVKAFQDSDCVDEIIVVTREEKVEELAALMSDSGFTKVTKVLKGGETRQDSVLIGTLEAGKCSLIAVHDGARPLVRPTHIARVIKDARVFGGATLGVPVKDTIKVVQDGIITATPDRATLYLTQTPQVFQSEGLKAAYRQGFSTAFTDDASVASAYGMPLTFVEGERLNIKLTTPEDMILAEAILSSSSN